MTKFVFALIFFLFVFTTGCKTTQREKDRRLTLKYQTQIGCTNYGRLKIAPGDYPEILEKTTAYLPQINEHRVPAGSLVFRSMNRGILFVHHNFQRTDSPRRDAVNFLYSVERDTIVGFYRCM